MTRSKRMQPIKNVADGRERQAGGELGAAQRELEHRERELAKLRSYEADYAARAARDGAPDVVRLQNYHTFLARLGDAIRQQEARVAEARDALERATAAWRERRIEAASLGKAVEHIAGVERRAADRRAQRESDEQAAGRAQRRSDRS